MAGINKVIIVGNLGNDVEIRYTQSGQAVATLSVATSESWTDKNSGQKQEQTEWHRVAVFGKLAEIANQYLHKGSKVYVEGKLKTRKWQDKQGNDRYTTEIVISGFGGTLQMLDKREDGGDYQQDTSAQQAEKTQTPAPEQQTPKTKKAENKVETVEAPDDFEDDIPF